MERGEALKLLRENIENQNLVKHCLAMEVAMKELANYFKEDQDKWGICGLLHDIDYEKTKGDPNTHSKVGKEMLKDLGFDEEICEAVLTHNEAHGILPQTLMAKALYCVDPLTGLIVAATLVLPSKKLADLEVENVLNRFREKAFARGANREIIKKCQEYLNLKLEDFVKIVLSSMQKISDDLGL
ncbi:HDIG domain-containing protein [Patescibacteria group bacterium]|nr:HDIG domain-containing protein [Patescibacteria group bacterium]